MALLPRFAAFAIACLPAAAAAENYLGILKPPRSEAPLPSGFLTLASEPVIGFSAYRAAENGPQRMKLGYKYSRYFSVEGQFVDFGRAPADVFATPGNLASGFRSTGFGVDTVATLPWRSFSFYGRLGAQRGETRNAFAAYSSSLLTDQVMRGSRLRYGLGMRYDFSKAFGIRADFERYSPLGTPLSGEPEADQVSVGFMWRF